jgi:hypothetical protein
MFVRFGRLLGIYYCNKIYLLSTLIESCLLDFMKSPLSVLKFPGRDDDRGWLLVKFFIGVDVVILVPKI